MARAAFVVMRGVGENRKKEVEREGNEKGEDGEEDDEEKEKMNRNQRNRNKISPILFVKIWMRFG